MDKERRQNISRWVRDIVISVVIVPAILLYFNMTPLVMIVGGCLTLAGFKIWENFPEIKTSFGNFKGFRKHMNYLLFETTMTLTLPKDGSAGVLASNLDEKQRRARKIFAWVMPLVMLSVVGCAFLLGFYVFPPGHQDGPNPIIYLPPKEDWKSRQFTLPDFGHLARFYDHNTTAQADQIVAPYIGNWVAVSGIVDNLLQYHDLTTVSLKGNYDRRNILELSFEKDWAKTMLRFEKDSDISAYCQISEINILGARLEKCELAKAPP